VLQVEDEENEVLSRADLAMYEVKHVGGNRVCFGDADGYRFVGGDMPPRAQSRRA
jgi:hypothetical protein